MSPILIGGLLIMRYWLLLLIFCTSNYAASPNSFGQAKKIAAQLFRAHPQTIYCQCAYVEKEVDLASCGMQAADAKKRAHRIEWEHLVAAEHIGQQFACWRIPMCSDKNGKPYKGRRCCQKIDAQYQHAESELYNLWPEVGLVNQARSNYRFGVLPQQSRYYGCAMTIDKSSRRAEPPDYAKGIIARAYLFMAAHYQLSLSKSQRQLFEAWNRQYKPSIWEQQWAKQIALIEGYENYYITHWQARKNINSMSG